MLSAREGQARSAIIELPLDPARKGRRELLLLSHRGPIHSSETAMRPSRRRRGRFELALVMGAVTALACVSKSPAPSDTQTVVDEIGRSIQVKPIPQRIVSLAPSITEILFALGLGDRVVGVTSYCDYPPEAAAKEKVGDTLRPSIERMVALKADLVIVSTASQLEAFVKNLDKLQIPLYVSDPRNLDGVLASIERIGELGGVADRSRELTWTLRARIDTVESRVRGLNRPRVLFILGTSPLITVGGRGFIDDLINRAGGRSISAGQSGDYPQFSLESAVAAQPEVIFLQSGETELSGSLKNTTAARDGRIFRLDDALLLRPGPRIVDGLEKMAARIHPEAFAEGENTK